MPAFTDLGDLDKPDILLEQEWMNTIDTPDVGLPKLLKALEVNFSMR